MGDHRESGALDVVISIYRQILPTLPKADELGIGVCFDAINRILNW